MPSVDNVNRYVMNENLKLFTQRRGSSLQVDTDKTNREVYNEYIYRSQKITGLRTIKSAPFKKKVEIIDSRPRTSASKTKGPLFDHIDNASLFSSDSKSSLINYNYKAISYKYPSLNRQAEFVRRNLFKNYMKSFKETSEIYKINEPLLDKNQKKNVTTEIHALISSFRRDDTNQAFLRRHEELVKQGELAKSAELDKKNIKKSDEKITNTVSSVTTTAKEGGSANVVVTTDSKKIKNDETNKIIPLTNRTNNVFPGKLEQILDEELKPKQMIKLKKATFDLSKNNQQYPDLTTSNLEIFTDENAYESYDDLIKEETDKSEKIDNDNLESLSPSIGYEIFDRYKNDDDKFYSKNKAKFMKDFEKGNLLINNFAREATQKREKCFKNTFKETPHAHTAKDLNLNTDSLKNELKRIRIAKILALNNKKSNKNDNKENIVNQYEDEDDDDFDLLDENEDDEDNPKNKDAIKKQKYEMRVKKRQHNQVLLKYMYEKAKKNKIKIDSILNKYRYDNEPKQDDLVTNEIEDLNNDDEETTLENNKQQLNFCISLPFRRDNISNYEIFIPKYTQKENHLYLMNNNASTSTSVLSLSTKSEINNDKDLDKELPLNYESLKISGVKIIESKSKSTFWQNYNKKK